MARSCEAVQQGELPQVLRVVEGRTQEARGPRCGRSREALEIAQPRQASFGACSGHPGRRPHGGAGASSDHRRAPWSSTFAGLAQRWGTFEDRARTSWTEALQAARTSTTARHLMWLLGLHVRIDFSRLALRGSCRHDSGRDGSSPPGSGSSGAARAPTRLTRCRVSAQGPEAEPPGWRCNILCKSAAETRAQYVAQLLGGFPSESTGRPPPGEEGSTER
jgi:hypothetical protein